MHELITMKDGVAVTDILTIAAGVDYRHKNVIALCRKHIHEIEEFGRVEFIIQSFETAGGTQRREVALLNEDQAILLMSLMQNNDTVTAFKVRLVKAFRACRDELGRARANPNAQLPNFMDPAAAAIAWADQYKRREALERKAQLDKPKIDFADSVTASDAEVSITTAAKTYGMPPRKLFDWLRLNGFIYKQANQATQDSINPGFMVVRFAAIQHRDGVEQKPYPHITGKGLYHFYRRLRKDGLIDRNETLELAG